jgi:LPS O-antigen subunit length determinant protein (WzzB/FepE family)
MRNKILIGIVALLALLVVSVRFMFNKKFEEFKVSVQQYENEQLANFQKEKEKKIAQLSNESLAQLFNQYFEESKSIIEKDTTFSFLYLSESVKYKIGRLDYFDCLHQKSIVEKQNETAQKQITLKEKELEKKFGNTFTSWYPKLKMKNYCKRQVELETVQISTLTYMKFHTRGTLGVSLKNL